MAKKVSSSDSMAALLASYGSTGTVEYIDSGIDALNTILGGGIALGYMYLLYGTPGSGKSTILYQVARSFCRQGRKVALIDSERALNSVQKGVFGLTEYEDSGMFIHLSVRFMNELEEVCKVLSDASAVDLVIVDSLSEVQPYADKTLTIADIRPGMRAAQATLLLPRIKHWFADAGISSFLVVHARANMQVGVVNPYAPKEKADGGYATMHVPDAIIKLSGSSKLKEKDPDSGGDRVVGVNVVMTTEKNKFTAPFQPQTRKLLYGVGISKRYELIDIALERGVIQKVGTSGYLLPSGDKIVGIGKLYGMSKDQFGALRDYMRSVTSEGVLG